jgi:hypothetical protein
MSALDALRAVARGEQPVGELLPPCRLEAFGSEFFGEEAVVQSFRAAPLEISDEAIVVAGGGHLAIFDGETALIADVPGENILRIWRLGVGEPIAAEPAMGVPFDADLIQSGADLMMRAEDHPALLPEAVAEVEEAGRSLARDWRTVDGSAPYRSRTFLVRAFTRGSNTVALFAIHSLGSAAVRTIGFSYAAALFRADGEKPVTPRIIRDEAGEAAIELRPWKPRAE